MAITAAGVGSGIDIEGILSQLNEVERQPIVALESRKEALNFELSAYGTAKSALNEFQTAAKALGSNTGFGGFIASSSDEEVFTATASNGNTAERHEVEVLSLATNHRLSSGAYASEDAAIEQGTLSFSSGDNSFDVVIDGSNGTLLGMRDAINDTIENTTVSASIINVDGGSRLVLTAKKSGTDGMINLSRQGALPLDTATNFSEITEALDASLVVHGFPVTSSSNSVSDVIDGVTLELVGTGKAIVDSQRDMTSLKESLDEFVSKYNSMISTLNDLGNTDLSGDQLPRGIENRMRESFFSTVDLGNNDTTTGLELGFTFDRDGNLSLDEDKYQSAITVGVDRYVNAFAQPEFGVATLFSDLVDGYTESGGVIDTREAGVDTRRDSIDSQIDRLEYRVERVNERLRRQFTAMDLTVTNLQSTSAFLANRLGNF